MGDVERELALAGISRMTFDWKADALAQSAWNVAVVEVMARKSVDWLRLSMPITNELAVQAPAIVQRWLEGKCREMTQYYDTDATRYDSQHKSKLIKAQFARWRKKVSFFCSLC